MEKKIQEEKTWEVKFAYSGSSKREFFTKEFTVSGIKSIDQAITEYVHAQNAGEPKSDRIRYWSKTLKTQSPH